MGSKALIYNFLINLLNISIIFYYVREERLWKQKKFLLPMMRNVL